MDSDYNAMTENIKNLDKHFNHLCRKYENNF